MTPSTLTTVSGIWALAAAALVLGLAYYAAVLDGVLTARDDGVAVRVRTPLSESARLLRQRRRVTVAADRLLWRIGGGGLIAAALLMVTVVPLGRWTLFDLDVGVVWFNAMDVVVWALVWLAGWGPNSAHSLIGGYRFLAQALGYELPLMFALVAPAIAAESLRVGTVADAQQGLWYVVWMPVAFVVYCIGVLGFSVWGPMSAAFGADIAGGAAAELSGVDRLLVLAGRYALLAAGSAFAVPLFLGGGAGPILPGWLWVIVKTVVLLTILVWLRRPLLRPDKFMEVGWLLLLPAVLVQDLIVAIVAVWR
ncbi:complex I subunit 1 family protein [Mycobacterium sp. IDR2000157661]|uniref:complex I subunit 1 family protein n=1 Tax=Mycobacterium sp. IDR2000157661 TaxID=2867005 RepID=UPI001EE9F754|nr:complex I subunit 1 family protein [Mycobacterium sp. IDR2000157661]ULE31922.1 NADH-quinone oxidoreductase subunit H [Mycobacterium sp. IDR2000157661]